GRRLNSALANKVQELAKYRSEFFGRLREILGNREDIQIVGDRFVFQSEVLFDSGSADIGPAGKDQLDVLATTLILLLPEIPKDIDWVLRVDGHTDDRPISSSQFPSNWELSTARAVAVVKYLASRGIPDDRLAAAGFGEFRPIDTSGTEEGRRKNRRIEIKFDQR
ncbi:MAG TPA: OmpA family protein, partial [Dongiaceae bacterium]|nr:OmpA family protein [Dongiaceae bacterium]